MMINVEKVLHENGGEKGKYLSLCYKYPLTITPSSVEAERAFSIAGYFCYRLRFRLSDDMISALSVLRTYYLSGQRLN